VTSKTVQQGSRSVLPMQRTFNLLILGLLLGHSSIELSEVPILPGELRIQLTLPVPEATNLCMDRLSIIRCRLGDAL
jgi:hypothetical protein